MTELRPAPPPPPIAPPPPAPPGARAVALQFIQPEDTARAGETFGLRVVIVDSAGRTVTTANDFVHIILETGRAAIRLEGITAVRSESGIAAFENLSLAGSSGVYTLAAVSAPLDTARVHPFVVRPGPAVDMSFADWPAPVAAGVTIDKPVVIELRDAWDNIAEDDNRDITLSISAGSISGTLTRTARSGRAAFDDLRFNQTGDGIELAASAPSLPPARTTPFSVYPRVSATAGATIALSHTSACGIAADGEAWCWGTNSSGSLGTGRVYRSSSPSRLAGGLRFSAIDPGSGTACGITTGQALYCWGGSVPGHDDEDTAIAYRAAPVRLWPDRSWQAVSVSSTRACALDVRGSAFCWGQLGTFYDAWRAPLVRAPRPAAGNHRFATISAGYMHQCGVAAGGAGYCWGGGGYYFGRDGGQLGNDSITDSPEPVLVSGGHTWRLIEAGSNHSCGLTTAGEAWCWGSNSAGNLGSGTSVESSRTPVRVAGGQVFTAMTAAGHTCALDAAARAWCWGGNANGELGDGSTTHRATPVAVAGNLTFATISAGSGHTCGIATGGSTWCWGSNNRGELGDNSTSRSPTPVQVSGPSLAVVRAGFGSTSCAIDHAGDGWCWGNNGGGELGDGNPIESRVPVASGSPVRLRQVTAGAFHHCALGQDDTAYCWGDNTRGASGRAPDSDPATSPARTDAGGRKWLSIATSFYAGCGVDQEGGTWCWGRGSPAISRLTGVPPLVSVTVGAEHACGLSAAGIAWCWGGNEYGQRGDGSRDPSTAPNPVGNGGLSFTNLTAGGFHTCGIARDGTTWCWGGIGVGEPGNGEPSTAAPVQVAGSQRFIALTGGTHYTCGLTASGAAWCWGGNYRGELGRATGGHAGNPPAPVSGGVAFSGIYAGLNSTCGVTSAGAAYCWGANDHGLLGNGTLADSSTPVAVQGPAFSTGR